MLGLLDQAREHRDQAVTSARTHSHTLAFVLGHGFFIDWCVNAELELLTVVDELKSLADERGFRRLVGPSCDAEGPLPCGFRTARRRTAPHWPRPRLLAAQWVR